MPGYARPTTVVLSTEVITQPTGDISASDLQGALSEIASEKLPIAIIDAKGDLIVGSANDTAARLPVGSDGYVLTASASASGGVTWAMGTAGATGGGTDQVFYNNDQIVTTNYSIPSGKNAISAGPITINTGISVTIPTGSSWVIA